MKKEFSYKQFIVRIGIMACCLLVPLSAGLSPKVEAASITEVLLGTAVQYEYFNRQLKYYDNDGRDKYFEQIKEKEGVSDDPELNEILEDVVTRLSSSIAQTDASVLEKPYNYFVNPQTTFNAFCTIGHNLSVNKGLFTLLNHNEDEVAVVVAHEMAHGQKGHPIKGYQKSVPLNVLTQLYKAQNQDNASQLLTNVIGNYATANGITKPQEWEADNLAFDYAVQAGYNPGAGAATWQKVIEKMGESSTNFVGEIFSPSDHPTNQARRDNYAKKLTEYSKSHVLVEDSVIKIRDSVFMQTTANDSMSGMERSYLVAGNLAAVYRNNDTIPEAYVEHGIVKMGEQEIVIPNADEPNADELVDILNKIK
ncbi:M48 family metallopeptidase [Anaerosinus massiliensis]|uniref:M48 family metallopeptidase n=1 Tax=Massilibacillus massiliensis TaxID=1806837 RepID=UPI000A50979A|nr:M48 family metallopeptidase [Massilibacillus massiliensis]